ncbi:hypothetical protein L1049_019883 [Liquidambar formosana]|uniref:Transposase MuDR plant domain-containing protein n=1 Tax=Liquidambar formosana TaxID=63359 RepID=A0AAP0SCC0_LIQFO
MNEMSLLPFKQKHKLFPSNPCAVLASRVAFTLAHTALPLALTHSTRTHTPPQSPVAVHPSPPVDGRRWSSSSHGIVIITRHRISRLPHRHRRTKHTNQTIEASRKRMSTKYYTFEIHHGGYFRHNPHKMYCGGKIDYIDNVDPDCMNWKDMLTELGKVGYHNPNNFKLHYCVPMKGMDDGLVLCYDDYSLMGMFECHRRFCLVKMFVEHFNMERGESVGSLEVDVAEGVVDEGVGDERVGDEGEWVGVDEGVGEEGEWVGDKRVGDEGEWDEDATDYSDSSSSDGTLFGDPEEDNLYDSDFVVDEDIEANIDIGMNANVIPEAMQEDVAVSGDEVISEYADSDDLISLDSSSDDEGGLKPVKYPEFCRERDMLKPKLVLGTTFATAQDFRDLLREVAIRKGYDLFFIKNDGDRITVKCRDNCGWRAKSDCERQRAAGGNFGNNMKIQYVLLTLLSLMFC